LTRGHTCLSRPIPRGLVQALREGGRHVWLASLMVLGELAIGAALILGVFTGIGASSGGFMNGAFGTPWAPRRTAPGPVAGRA
jgi:uncharacterized membrane protein YphA (DoxX/SURF4 family)